MAEATRKSRLSALDRLIEDLPLSPIGLGFAVAGLLVGGFAVSELLMGRHRLLSAESDPIQATRDARIAIVHCLLSAYLPIATLMIRARTRENLLALVRNPDADAGELERLAGEVGRSGAAVTWLARAAGILLIVGAAYVSTPREYWFLLWDLPAMSPEVRWHRILGFWVGWWVGDYVRVGIAESARMSRAAASLGTLELIDPTLLAPYTRQALTILLAAVGLASVVALFVLEDGYISLVSGIWIITIVFSGLTMWVGLRGIHARIQLAKADELARCRMRLGHARAALDAGQSAEPPLAELAAWEARILSIREWPFDTGALTRIGLYGLIPVLSWSGGALVERLIDALLD